GEVTPPAGADPYLGRLATVAAACNDAALRPPTDPSGDWQITGDPTEAALLALAGRLGVDPDTARRDLPRIEEISFDATRRRMTTLHHRDGRVLIATKGALESLAPSLEPDDGTVADQAREVAHRWAADGLRVLALADRTTLDPGADPEAGLRLVGLVGIADPPRPEAAAAIAECRQAGIDTVIVTGDHAATAAAVARRIGVSTSVGSVMTGAELDALDDAGLARRVGNVGLFARVAPAQKLRIVDAWRSAGAVVAVTGDGVNDAPALRHADIGVAMGGIGTDVSKEAADMVLADDNFATIVHAVDEGRRIYDNIRRTVRYLITTNSGEVWVMFLAPLIGLPLPLLPVQILWINLVTDSLPAVALGLQPAEPDTMHRPPRAPTESLFARGLWQHAAAIGLLMAAVVLPMQAAARAAGWHWQTMVFTTLAFLQLGHALAVRAERRSTLRWRQAPNPWLYAAVAGTVAAQLALVYLPVLHHLFGTTALGPGEMLVVTGASTATFLAVEIEKWLSRRGDPRPAPPDDSASAARARLEDRTLVA
ncbi:MAG TPA: HAD-IC family P-type ATPase, partial [Acidimicrobiales bacterium]|nr:HAD-IC family P-type ATPase [Acidimicrobiales bacterium]